MCIRDRYFVNEHARQGTIRLYNYTSDVEQDVDAACREVMEEDPLGAFAVADIHYTASRIVSYYEVAVSLSYSHTAQEVDAIRSVSGTTAIQQQLRQAMANFSSSLVPVSYTHLYEITDSYSSEGPSCRFIDHFGGADLRAFLRLVL